MKRKSVEFFLTLVALFTGGAVPIFMSLLGPMYAMQRHGVRMQQMVHSLPPPEMKMQMMQTIHQFMAAYIPYLLLPSLVVLLLIWRFSSGKYPRLANRISAGLGAGFLAAVALDVIRVSSFPGDMPTMFGQMITGQMAGPAVLLTGYLYHALNGLDFGLVYTLVAGKVRWYWALAWTTFIELGMMLSPPLMMTAGPFGIHGFWPRIFIVSLLAHIAMGIALGIFAERWVRDRGSIFTLISLEESIPT